MTPATHRIGLAALAIQSKTMNAPCAAWKAVTTSTVS